MDYEQELAKVHQAARDDGINVDVAMKEFLDYHLSARTEKTLSWQVGGWGPWTVGIGGLVLFEVFGALVRIKDG